MPKVQAFLLCEELREEAGKISVIGVMEGLQITQFPSRVKFRAILGISELRADTVYRTSVNAYYNSNDPYGGFTIKPFGPYADGEFVTIGLVSDDFLVLGYDKIELRVMINDEHIDTIHIPVIEKGGEDQSGNHNE